MALAAFDLSSAPLMAPYAYVSTEAQGPMRSFFESDSIRSTISEIRVGSTAYPFRQPCSARFIPVNGEFLVDGFSPFFIGHGDNPKQARKNWDMAVHASFQKLVHMRPIEKSTEDKRLWSVLSSRIDVTVYRNQTPITVRQYGCISMLRPYPQQIRWESGEREDITIDQVESPDFITLPAFQTFEAIVERDPITFRLLRIVHIERQAKAARLPPDEEAQLLSSIGSSKTLPNAEWSAFGDCE